MRYCGHFLIKAEGGAKKYKRDHPLPFLATLYRRFRAAKGLDNSGPIQVELTYSSIVAIIILLNI